MAWQVPRHGGRPCRCRHEGPLRAAVAAFAAARRTAARRRVPTHRRWRMLRWCRRAVGASGRRHARAWCHRRRRCCRARSGGRRRRSRPGRGRRHGGPGRGRRHGPGRGWRHGPGRGWRHGPGRSRLRCRSLGLGNRLTRLRLRLGLLGSRLLARALLCYHALLLARRSRLFCLLCLLRFRLLRLLRLRLRFLRHDRPPIVSAQISVRLSVRFKHPCGADIYGPPSLPSISDRP